MASSPNLIVPPPETPGTGGLKPDSSSWCTYALPLQKCHQGGPWKGFTRLNRDGNPDEGRWRRPW